jgi:hypothetical protein
MPPRWPADAIATRMRGRRGAVPLLSLSIAPGAQSADPACNVKSVEKSPTAYENVAASTNAGLLAITQKHQPSHNGHCSPPLRSATFARLSSARPAMPFASPPLGPSY